MNDRAFIRAMLSASPDTIQAQADELNRLARIKRQEIANRNARTFLTVQEMRRKLTTV